MRRPIPLRPCGLLAAIVLLAALPAAARPPSVVLVVNDTMRRDRVGAYGGTARTPHFDAFAGAHARFEAARTQSPWTKPSMATLFTSLYPSQHGVASDPFLRTRDGEAPVVAADRLAEGFPTLAEVLRGGGLRTVAFVANPWLLGRYGFDQGFDVYDDSFASWQVEGRMLTDRALRWLEEESGEEPFFLYLHYLDSHRPYPGLTEAEAHAHARPPAPGEPPFLGALRERVGTLVRLADGRPLAAVAPPSPGHLHRAYDKGVERFDRELGRLLAALEAHPAWPETIVVVTSDHGEALFERGHGNHGAHLFEEEVTVPLAVRLPGTPAGRLPTAAPVGLVDLLPTVCDASGLPCPDAMAGRSWLAGGAAPERAVVEGTMVDPRNRALVEDGYKLVYEPVRPGRPGPPPTGRDAWSLYDLGADPRETRDLLRAAAGDPAVEERFARMRGALVAAVAPMEAPPADLLEISPEELERLRAIGYVE